MPSKTLAGTTQDMISALPFGNDSKPVVRHIINNNGYFRLDDNIHRDLWWEKDKFKDPRALLDSLYDSSNRTNTRMFACESDDTSKDVEIFVSSQKDLDEWHSKFDVLELDNFYDKEMEFIRSRQKKCIKRMPVFMDDKQVLFDASSPGAPMNAESSYRDYAFYAESRKVCFDGSRIVYFTDTHVNTGFERPDDALFSAFQNMSKDGFDGNVYVGSLRDGSENTCLNVKTDELRKVIGRDGNPIVLPVFDQTVLYAMNRAGEKKSIKFDANALGSWYMNEKHRRSGKVLDESVEDLAKSKMLARTDRIAMVEAMLEKKYDKPKTLSDFQSN